MAQLHALDLRIPGLGAHRPNFASGFKGVLLETKAAGYAQWIDKRLEFFGNFQGRDQMLEQARRQFKAANGTPIRWIVAEEKLAGALRILFKEAGLKIEVIHVSPTP